MRRDFVIGCTLKQWLPMLPPKGKKGREQLVDIELTIGIEPAVELNSPKLAIDRIAVPGLAVLTVTDDPAGMLGARSAPVMMSKLGS